jgi:hypothetical protein
VRIPRITLRRLMIIVVVAALAIGIEAGRRRRETYLGLARTHRGESSRYFRLGHLAPWEIQGHRDEAARFRKSIISADWPRARAEETLARKLEADSRAYSQLGLYHSQMAEKYREAARLPLRGVEPDPPAPPEPKGP